MITRRIFFPIIAVLLVACNTQSTNTRANTSLTANAGEDIQVKEQQLVTLSGQANNTNSSDITYRWHQTAGASVSLDNKTIATPQFTAPSVDEVLTFQLTVADGTGATKVDSVNVTVNLNQAPSVEAGENQTVLEQTQVTLTGIANDEDGSIVSYAWQQTSGTTVTLTNADSEAVSFTAPSITETSITETLVFTLTVTDDFGATATDTINVSVYPNLPPLVSAGDDQWVLEQSQVTLSGAANDEDGSVVSYSWQQTSGTAVTLASANTATSTFSAPSVAETLVFALTVTDNFGSTSTDSVSIFVTPDLPPSVNAGEDQWVLEQSQVSLSGVASDEDGNIVSYIWQQTSGTAVALVDANTANATFSAHAFEEILTFTLTVTDDFGTSTSDSITIHISSNIAPTVDAGEDQSVFEQTQVNLSGVASDEDGSIDAYLWEQTAGTPVSITAAHSATATFSAPSTTDTLIFTLKVTDNLGAMKTDSINIHVSCLTGSKGDQCNTLNYNNPPDEFRVQVDKDGVSRTFNLKKFIASDSLKVKVVEADSSTNDHEVTSLTPQYIGSVEEESASIVSASILPNGSLRYVVSSGDDSGDWEFIPGEETDPNAAINAYTLLKTDPIPFTATTYAGATYITPQKGGFTRDATIYNSHLDFVLTKDYTDVYTNDVDAIIRKAETSVTQMNSVMLRDLMLESQISQILIRRDESPEYTTGRDQLDTFSMNNLSNYVTTVDAYGGGLSPVCRSGGDLSDTDEQGGSQGLSGSSADGIWYGVMRHEYGHALGSGHFPGNSPEGPTIMSGNAKSKFSGDEILNFEWCFENKGIANFKASSPASEYSEHEIPPVARLDRYLEVESDGSITVDVLLNDHDTNGDQIAIKDFDAISELGATVSFIPANESSPRDLLHYTPQASGPSPDACGDLCNSTDLLLWLDASDKDTLIDVNDNTGADIVHQAQLKKWLDKSSHNNDAEVFAATSNPEVKLVGSQLIGNLPVIHLNDDLMEIRGIDISAETHSEITSIAVVNYADGYPTLWAQKINDGNKRFHDVSPGKNVKTIIHGSEEYSEWINKLHSRTSTITPEATETGIALGASLYAWENYGGAYFANMAVAELLIFNRRLTEQERLDIESYLAKKWSLTIDDRFTYTITDDTGRTSQGLVYVPQVFEEKPNLTALDGKSIYLRNRKDCDAGSTLCDWHLSWFNSEAYLTNKTNTADLVPWELSLVPDTTNQFYITNTWGCPSDARCNHKLMFNSWGGIDIADTDKLIPYEFILVPGVDQSDPIKEYYIYNKYQCEEKDIRCKSPLVFGGAGRVILEYPYREPVPWSVEILP